MSASGSHIADTLSTKDEYMDESSIMSIKGFVDDVTTETTSTILEGICCVRDFEKEQKVANKIKTNFKWALQEEYNITKVKQKKYQIVHLL